MLARELKNVALKCKSRVSRPNSPRTRPNTPYQASYSTKASSKWFNWGSNDHGTLARGDLYEVSAAPVEIESVNSLGLDQLSLGQNVCVGRSTATGKSYVWGENHGGSVVTSMMGDIIRPKALPGSSLVSAGWDSIWVVSEEGTIANSYGMRNVTVDLGKSQQAKVAEIFSSAFQTIFLRSDGSLTLHNDRPDAPFQKLDFSRPVVQVARGWSHFLLLDDSGSVWSVGANKHGQCGVGHTDTLLTPTLLPHLKGTKIKRITSGATHSLALTESGAVLCWGSFKDGKLGITTDKDHTEPTEMTFFSDKNIVQLAGGCDHSAVVSKNGDIYTWGFGQHGALGLGDLKDAPTPQKIKSFVSQPHSIIDVQCGMDTTFVHVQI